MVDLQVPDITTTAGFFETMARVESIHAENLRRQSVEMKVGELPRLSSRWQSPEGPETIDFEDLHYLMSARQALLLARHNETRAVAFFASIAERAETDTLKTLALEMADEERHHVQLLDDWLSKHQEDDDDWAEDMDEPISQD